MGSSTNKVVTRFAPSPTGFLHIGGARTALFNWLLARRHGGRFLLRIEDTDRARCTQEAIDAILEGLGWLGLDWDDDWVSQTTRADRHREVAGALLDRGHAYRCYAGREEIEAAREQARKEKRPLRFESPWRDRDTSDAPADRNCVVRLRAPRDGETIIEDHVQGRVKVANAELDDMVLLRADGSPTYMLAVVVDDIDMGITHVVRGDDHLTNAFRQVQICRAMSWTPPEYAHIPLLHGPDGKKLSKRHGALGVAAYRDMGYLPEAMRNYLLRLGWGHGDTELISTEDAIRIFDVDDIGKGAARFDFKKLDSFNAHYIRQAEDARLTGLVRPFIETKLDHAIAEADIERLRTAMPGLKERAKTLVDLADSALYLFRQRPIELNDKADKILDSDARRMLGRLLPELSEADEWTETTLEKIVGSFAETEDLKLGKVAQPMRAALTGSNISPGIYEVLVGLGREESLARLGDQAENPD